MLSACAGTQVCPCANQALGQVEEVYVKAAGGVYVAADRVPDSVKEGSERWVEVRICEPGCRQAEALVDASAGVEVGDLVEIRLAQEQNPRYLPVREITRVVRLVARRDERPAREYAQEFAARGRSAVTLHSTLSRSSL